MSYFDYSVGISHIRHFGKNILFQTIVSHLTGEFEYIDFGSISETYNTIYSSDEFAYILGYNGKMLVIDENKNHEVFNPFSELEKEINYFYIQGSTLKLVKFMWLK